MLRELRIAFTAATIAIMVIAGISAAGSFVAPAQAGISFNGLD